MGISVKNVINLQNLTNQILGIEWESFQSVIGISQTNKSRLALWNYKENVGWVS